MGAGQRGARPNRCCMPAIGTLGNSKKWCGVRGNAVVLDRASASVRSIESCIASRRVFSEAVGSRATDPGGDERVRRFRLAPGGARPLAPCRVFGRGRSRKVGFSVQAVRRQRCGTGACPRVAVAALWPGAGLTWAKGNMSLDDFCHHGPRAFEGPQDDNTDDHPSSLSSSAAGRPSLSYVVGRTSYIVRHPPPSIVRRPL